MSFTEMTLTELAAVATCGLVILYAVADGLWPHPSGERIRSLFKI